MAGRTSKKKKKIVKVAPEGLMEIILGAGIIGALYQILASSKGNLKFISRGKRSQKELDACIKRVKGVAINANIFYTDLTYQVFTVQDLQRFLKMDNTDKMKYVADKWDCDNFAVLLYAMAEIAMPGCCFGELWASTPNGMHAVNFFVDNLNRFYTIEPQSDEITSGVPKDWTVLWIRI